MRLTKSYPSKSRIITALSVFIATGFIALIIRLSRPDVGIFPILLPLDFNGTSPNFFVCFACPLMVLFHPKDTIGIVGYGMLAYAEAIGFTVYEFIQIHLARRTFDEADIIASFIGATTSLVFVTFVFLVEYRDMK